MKAFLNPGDEILVPDPGYTQLVSAIRLAGGVALPMPLSVEDNFMPDLELTGTVESINPVYEEKRGDITYTARILLDSVDPRLRWGMTVAITFIK